MNNELYEMMLSLCPPEWHYIKVENSSATGYLDYIFSNKFETKWVLNLDEDCFIKDFNEVIKLIEYLETNNFDYCGIQDGGSISVRIHNPLAINPFFNLFDVEKISSLDKDDLYKNYDIEEIKYKYNYFIRFLEREYKFDFFEPFYAHFFWLLENNLKPYFMNAEDFTRERYLVIAPLLRIIPYYNFPTLIKNFNGNEIAVHTWHSRYLNYRNIRKHINNCFNFALNGHKKNNNKFDKIILNK